MNKPCAKCELANAIHTENGRTKYFGFRPDCRNCEKYSKYEEYLESRRQYRRGDRVESISEYLALKEQGQTLFYFINSIRHFAVLENMPFKTLSKTIQDGYIYRAERKRDDEQVT